MRLRRFTRLLMAELLAPLAPTAAPTPPEYGPLTSTGPLGPNNVTLSPAASSKLASGFSKRPGDTDAALDADHAAHGRGAARFLSVRDFDDVASVRAALAAIPDCEVWCSDLGQGATVLARDAPPWAATEEETTLPRRVAIVFGTESTGVSREFLAHCDRRVYVPMHGFAESLNVGVAAALALDKIMALLGAGGDLATDADWRPDGGGPDALRERWARSLSRDNHQFEQIKGALSEGGLAVFDDLRRPDEFRQHTGRPNRPTRRSMTNRAAEVHDEAQGAERRGVAP